MKRSNTFFANILLMFAVIISCTRIGAQQNYYVSNSGTGDTLNTIAEVNALSLNPGDSVLFKRGGVWYIHKDTTLYIKDDGAKDNHITYSSYGSGAKPKLYGGINVLGFTAHETLSNVYRCDSLIDNDLNDLPTKSGWGNHPGSAWAIFGTDSVKWLDGILDGETTFGGLDANYEWLWQNDSLYFYYDGNINDIDTLAVTQVYRCVDVLSPLTAGDYITIDGFDIRYASSRTVSAYSYTTKYGLYFRNNHIAYTGSVDGDGLGCQLYYTDAVYENNVFHTHGRRCFSIYTANGQTIRNVIVQDNEIYDAIHTGFDIATNNASDILRNIIIRRNHVHSPSGLHGTAEISLIGNYVDKTQFDSIFIYNNVFELGGYGNFILDFNNVGDHKYVIYNTITTTGAGIISTPSYEDNSHWTWMNNIIVDLTTDQKIKFYDFTDPVHLDTMDYNIYFNYSPTQTHSFATGAPGGTYGWDDWDSWQGNGWDVHSYQANPMFVDSVADFHLKEGSPAIGAGKPIPLITTDYEGNARDPLHPSIGAYEYISGNTAVIPEQNRAFNVYPNPASDLVNIDFGEMVITDPVTIFIYNLTGKVVFQGTYDNVDNEIQVPLQLLNEIYTLQIILNSGKSFSTNLAVIRQ